MKATGKRGYIHYKRISTYLESNTQSKKRWLSLGIGFASAFVLVIQNSMGWSSIYPYLVQIDEAASETFYGPVISAMAVGVIVSSPVLSAISERLSSFKIPILIGFAFNIAGNLLIIFVEEIQANRRWVLFAARLSEGFGTNSALGSRGVLSAYTAMATRADERNLGLSLQTAICSAALMVGPGIQAAAATIGYPGYKIGCLRLNMYTTPALFCIILVTLLAVLVVVVFKEDNLAEDALNDAICGITVEADNTTNHDDEKPSCDKKAATLCILTRSCTMFCVACFGTISAPLTMLMFNWSSQEAIEYNGIVKLCSGIVDVVGNLVVANVVLKYTTERVMMIVGLLSFLMCYVSSFSYPYILHDLIHPDATTNSTATTGSYCDYDWCPYTTRINLTQYIIANIFIAISILSVFAPALILLTKIVGPRHQRLYHGIATTSDYVALLCGPIVMSTVFQSSGPRVAWVIAAVILTTCIVSNILLFNSLATHSESKIIIHSCSGSEQSLESN